MARGFLHERLSYACRHPKPFTHLDRWRRFGPTPKADTPSVYGYVPLLQKGRARPCVSAGDASAEWTLGECRRLDDTGSYLFPNLGELCCRARGSRNREAKGQPEDAEEASEYVNEEQEPIYSVQHV